jgi:hypothetical protein
MFAHLFVFCIILGIPGLIALFVHRAKNIDPIHLQQLQLEEKNEEIEFGPLHKGVTYNTNGYPMVGGLGLDASGKPYGSTE